MHIQVQESPESLSRLSSNVIKPNSPNDAVVFGDMHGNALKFVWLLHQNGFLDIDRHTYAQFRDIYYTETYDIKREHLDVLKTRILRPENFRKVGKLYLIGDLLADRGRNDFYILLIFDALLHAGIDYEINLSNHDAIAIGNYEINNFTDIKAEIEYPGYTVQNIATFQVKSLLEMRKLIQRHIITPAEVSKIFERAYLPFLRLVIPLANLKTKQLCLLTHARIHLTEDQPGLFTSVCAVASLLGIQVTSRQLSKLPSCLELIESINKSFGKYLTNKQIHILFRYHDENPTPINDLIWGRPRFSLEDLPLNAICDYSISYINGHDTSKSQEDSSYYCVDDNFGKEFHYHTDIAYFSSLLDDEPDQNRETKILAIAEHIGLRPRKQLVTFDAFCDAMDRRSFEMEDLLSADEIERFQHFGSKLARTVTEFLGESDTLRVARLSDIDTFACKSHREPSEVFRKISEILSRVEWERVIPPTIENADGTSLFGFSREALLDDINYLISLMNSESSIQFKLESLAVREFHILTINQANQWLALSNIFRLLKELDLIELNFQPEMVIALLQDACKRLCESREQLQSQVGYMNLSTLSSEVDLPNDTKDVIAFANMQSNALKLVWLLHRHGFLTLSDDDYMILASIYYKNAEDITTEDLARFESILHPRKFHLVASINFLGELLASDGSNDLFILLILNAMHSAGIHYVINLSRSDLATIANLYTNEFNDIQGCFDGETAALNHLLNPEYTMPSLFAMKALIERNIISAAYVADMFKRVYIPCLTLLSYVIDSHDKSITIFSHNRVHFSQTHTQGSSSTKNEKYTLAISLKVIAKMFYIQLESEQVNPATLIDQINDEFRQLCNPLCFSSIFTEYNALAEWFYFLSGENSSLIIPRAENIFTSYQIHYVSSSPEHALDRYNSYSSIGDAIGKGSSTEGNYKTVICHDNKPDCGLMINPMDRSRAALVELHTTLLGVSSWQPLIAKRSSDQSMLRIPQEPALQFFTSPSPSDTYVNGIEKIIRILASDEPIGEKMKMIGNIGAKNHNEEDTNNFRRSLFVMMKTIKHSELQSGYFLEIINSLIQQVPSLTETTGTTVSENRTFDL